MEPPLPPDPSPEPRSVDSSWESAVARDVLVGTKVGEYEVVRRVGMGGMGFVYEALQPLIGRRVALKILRPQISADPSQVERLLAEARVVSAIHHRGIIDVFGFGELPNVGHYMVMEFLAGQPLDRELATRPLLPLSEVFDILDQTLAALEAAHEARVIHRDLKPSNIFLVEETGGPRYVKLLDFGLAKRSERAGEAVAQTQRSLISGTPAYMAPEQAQGKPVTARSDLYAVGCVAFEMLTRHLPFEGGGPIEVAYRHVHEPAPLVKSFRPNLPDSVEVFVQRLLQKEPDARYATASETRAELLRVFRELPAEGDGGLLIDPVGATMTSGRGLPAAHFSDRRPALSSGRTGLSDTIRREPVSPSPDLVLGIPASRRARAYAGAAAVVLFSVAGGYFAARPEVVEVAPELVGINSEELHAKPAPAPVPAPPPSPPPDPGAAKPVEAAPPTRPAVATGESPAAVVPAAARAERQASAEEEIERGKKALSEKLRSLRDDYAAKHPAAPADDPVLLAIAEQRKRVQGIATAAELASVKESVRKFEIEVRRFER